MSPGQRRESDCKQSNHTRTLTKGLPRARKVLVINETKLPNLDSSIDSDNPDDSDTERQHIDDRRKKKRGYKKEEDKKTGVKYPVCGRISETELSSD